MTTLLWTSAAVALSLAGSALLLAWGSCWGSTSRERRMALPGDDDLEGERPARVVLTRAVSIAAPPERVWPWLAQLGRGAGWYSIDRLDNGGRTSARHLVTWIPEPRLGDATAIGYLRHLDPGRGLAWWIDDARFLGARARSVTAFALEPFGPGTRLVCRITADATGPTARLALLVFRAVDSLMAIRQLLGLRQRAESGALARRRSREAETGARDQYQLYEVLYARGTGAGVPGREEGARCRRSALRDGALVG